MKSSDYRKIVESLANSALIKMLPGIKIKNRKEASREIAIRVHARMYGADVDNVASPLYADIYPDRLPTVSGLELLAQHRENEE